MLRNEFTGVEVIRNDEPRGFGANHNRVLARALEDPADFSAALVLNDDTVLPPGSIRALIECMEREENPGAVTPELVGPDGQRQPAAFRSRSQRAAVAREFVRSRETLEDPHHPDWLNGCCLLIPFSVLGDIGLFDERFFMYAEDVDLTMRIRARGLRLWQCPESSIVHYGAGTTGRPELTGPMQLQAARSHYLLIEKHQGTRVAFFTTTAFRLAHLLRGCAQLVVGRVTGDDTRRQAGRGRLRYARYNPRHAVFPEQERW
jgi:GT2 family glycosyltransferase